MWVRKYPGHWDGFERMHPSVIDQDPEWWLFHATGKLFALFTAPRELMIHAIEKSRVIGVRLDANDVPQLLVIPIRDTSSVRPVQ